ncbi:MAG: helix-turn-helix transcriptional regulator, partial [Anaerolineae bacterium]
RVDHLVRALQRQGVWPLVDLPGREPSNAAAFDFGTAAYAWVAGQVYAKLSRWIELPQPMPAAVLDDLATPSSPETYAIARQVVDDAIGRLADAMDGWARYPMPGVGLPPEDTLPLIEKAITAGRTLQMTYWTAGRGERTVRTVDPYRIEWRDDVPYLVGYCHERQAERVFRVDRIQELEVG